jgi:hypothetical protein
MLAASQAAMVVLVVSDLLYDGVVRHAYEGIDPDGSKPVRVHGKETSARAWVHLPGLVAQPQPPAVLAIPTAGPVSLPIPRELPRAPGDFTGRAGELSALRKLLRADASNAARAASSRPAWRAGGRARPMVIAVVGGMGGIGKSALALQLANQLADAGAFPDGQLYVNLQGATRVWSPWSRWMRSASRFTPAFTLAPLTCGDLAVLPLAVEGRRRMHG